MEKKPDFDLQAAHKYFSAYCFNHAWDSIDKSERSLEEENTMLQLSLASLWHWTQREDHTPKNLSVGYWQVSRVFALLGQVDNARKYGQLSLDTASKGGLDPFHMGYAYEALARAEHVAGNRVDTQKYLEKAAQLAEQVSDPEDKKLLLNDLASLR